MKSLMVVSQLNDPFYIDYDVDFAKYIIGRAKSGGLIDQDAAPTELDPNLVMQLFSPVVLSQWLLIDQTKEPCSSILCPDGFLFAFKHSDDLLFMALNGDGTESETFLHRKIQVFITIMRFIFGPASEEMIQSQFYSKKGKWDFLHQLMQNWSDLVLSEQAFLAEAVERVHVNQLVNEKCMETLLKSVKQFQAAKDQPTHHALLLVNSKLLALYSNRSAHELRPKDLLMAMILSKTMYPQTDRLEDLFSKFYTSTKSQIEPSSTADDNSDAGEDEYHSAPNTPRSNRSQSPSVHKLETIKNSDFSDQESHSEKSMEGVTLLDMFMERCPDVVFAKENNKSNEKLCMPDEQFTEREKMDREITKISHTVNVEAIVHQVADGSLGFETSDINTSQENHNAADQESASTFDLLNSSQLNGIICKSSSLAKSDVTSHSHSEKIKSENDSDKSANESSLNIVTSESLQKGSVDHNSLANENNVPLYFEHKAQSEMGNNGDNSAVSKSPGTAVPVKLGLTVGHENKQNPPGDIIAVEASLSLLANINEQSTLSHQQLVLKLSNENLSNGRLPVTNKNLPHPEMSTHTFSASSDRSSKSRNSAPSQRGIETEMPSHTSSGAKVSRSEDLNTKTAASKMIMKAVEHLKSASVLHSSLPITTKPSAESSTVTNNTTNSLSAFSKSSNSGIYLPQTIFLETSTCLYSPYNLYTVQISPGLSLIMLSQAPKHSLADSLYQVIQTIQDVIYGRRSKLPRSRGIYVYDTLNGQLGKIHNNLKKMKGRMKNLSYDALVRWEKEDLKQKLLDFLEKDSSFRIPQELESALMELYKKLRELFSLLFLSPVSYTSHLWDTLSQIRDHIRTDLMDYREYLIVKAQRNITMTSYIDEFPGLVHFIFIDRHFHQMTAPSLNISLKAGENIDATSYLKEKIWTMYQHMMGKLTEGYTTVMMRDGDFYFSYFLWFEDYMGNPLPVQESYKPSRKQPYPGILCGQFYKDLLQSCFPHAIQGSVHCIEMFLMHVGTVHPMYIAAHSRKLAYKMWEMSGETHYSVNLL